MTAEEHYKQAQRKMDEAHFQALYWYTRTLECQHADEKVLAVWRRTVEKLQARLYPGEEEVFCAPQPRPPIYPAEWLEVQ
ncbi:MAG: hypothetical protein MN733_01085 [Nitrososphaera sp.]|nr:hypothetical protein [Nitrososphaera sp.]